ncbi:MAG: hypothetical protein K8W52_17400 [Deltaproteobacteria bacterium]|nr:hypothetical protein [Deltaproteobacteria bacterium]
MPRNAQPTLTAIKPYVARYDIRAEGATVVGTMEATEAQIEMFVDLARSAMPTGNEPRTDH